MRIVKYVTVAFFLFDDCVTVVVFGGVRGADYHRLADAHSAGVMNATVIAYFILTTRFKSPTRPISAKLLLANHPTLKGWKLVDSSS